MVSEARLAEFLTTSHLAFFVVALAALQAVRMVKAIFRMLRSGVSELFRFVSSVHGGYYDLLGEMAEHRQNYKERLEPSGE